MLPFAVHIEGFHEEGHGSWVLAVDHDGVLIPHTDGSLHWHPLSDCQLLKAHTPEQPLMVVSVQPASNGIALPGVRPNRAMRREDLRGLN